MLTEKVCQPVVLRVSLTLHTPSSRPILKPVFPNKNILYIKLVLFYSS
ncbi:hypothetical protein Hsw_3252 [Hymenobacter swuensis DY53]|uniref:Uncharacterized protein n=1 Tax=Hymenobacter swuensis DY53 TaxID=1227739 RepID=W8F4A0_9BACT|nr:hypothetical protein Hsw_3252 [Hymenobacter swuensis DY53]